MNSSGQKIILLVEDEILIAMTESRELQRYGYDIIHVLNGRKAIESINSSKPKIDLILMDINLGMDIDGTETARMILKDHDIPILFLSSHTEREVVDKTENITSYGYVVKNSGITILDASIKMAFRLHEAYLNLKQQKKKIKDKEKKLEIFEKRYRRLFESAKDGILILDAETGMIDDVNPFLIDMLGYSKEEFLEKHIWEISAIKNITYSKELFKELQKKEYVRYLDLPLETAAGDLIHVEFVSNVYLVDHEKVIQCNIRDITDRMYYEKTLTNNNDEKSALLKELQHRTKNSLSLITNLIELRSNASDSIEVKKTLEELELRVRSISDLYTLLYETDSYYNVQLNTYCKKVIGSMIKLSEIITINKHLEEITVSTRDAAVIGMILVELVTNAIKYAFTGDQKGSITIELKKTDTGMILTVSDNGKGMPEGFDITKTKSMGLHLVSLMVSQLKGSINIITDKGTKIIIACNL